MLLAKTHDEISCGNISVIFKFELGNIANHNTYILSGKYQTFNVVVVVILVLLLLRNKDNHKKLFTL